MAKTAEERTVLIAGPTASGKSAAALAAAERIGGEIVNADAIQVYRDLRIISARPSAEDERRAGHHLYGHVDGAVRYSAGEWSRDAASIIAVIHARVAVAIVVGGTGLYFRALLKGLAETPEIPLEVRLAAAARFDEVGADEFRREVISFDPGAARLDPSDRQRHIRAWEVYHACGESLTSIQEKPARPMISGAGARIVIEPQRADVYRAASARFDRMMALGALDEVRMLTARRLRPDLPVMKAVGAAELLAHLDGELSLDEASELARRNTRRFIKRQLTWFRHQAPDWTRVRTPESAASLVCSQFVASPPP